MEQSLTIFFKYFKDNGPCYMHALGNLFKLVSQFTILEAVG